MFIKFFENTNLRTILKYGEMQKQHQTTLRFANDLKIIQNMADQLWRTGSI